jgi:hypothetical protein
MTENKFSYEARLAIIDQIVDTILIFTEINKMDTISGAELKFSIEDLAERLVESMGLEVIDFNEVSKEIFVRISLQSPSDFVE